MTAMIEEYIKSLIDNCIAATIPEELSMTELKRKRDELKSRLEECDRCLPERTDRLKRLLTENVELNKHVAVMESTFSDLVEKYEKAKTAVMCYRQREEIKTEHVRKMTESIEKIEGKYSGLKANAIGELGKASAELVRTRNKGERELHKYITLVGGLRIKYSNVLQDFNRKTKELASLTDVFDEISTKGPK